MEHVISVLIEIVENGSLITSETREGERSAVAKTSSEAIMVASALLKGNSTLSSPIKDVGEKS